MAYQNVGLGVGTNDKRKLLKKLERLALAADNRMK